jgi:acyl-CoA hydrolase
VSPGGKAFICLTSTFTDKQGEMVSRITPLLNPGDIVTDPRSLAYYIVTEYGGVNLVGCSTWERAERLISVAHPKFRDELVEHARQQGIWIRSNKR